MGVKRPTPIASAPCGCCRWSSRCCRCWRCGCIIGQYERCQPHHSWNSNHIFSNLLLFHLERHSDHHANPLRRYQSLRHFGDVPRLPTGYFGMFLLAYVPPLWFRVMDRRLLALPHVAGDLSRVNRG